MTTTTTRRSTLTKRRRTPYKAKQARHRKWDSSYNASAPGEIIKGSDVAEASASFRKSISQTYDGMHVSHWQHLEHRRQDITAKLFQLTLAIGMMPEQVAAVVATAIPKATTGFRTVGSFAAYYRMLMRTCSPLLKQWEAAHPNKHFSFTAGKSAVLTVWAQAAEQELTSAIGRPSSATILWDLSDFYEGMCRSRLLARGIEQGLPAGLAHLSISAYSGERVQTLNGCATSAGYPSKGVVAGCGAATYHVQVYHTPPINKFMTAHGQMGLNIHIDDLALAATGRSDEKVLEKISEGAAALQGIIHDDLGSHISIPKANLVATSDSLRKRVGKPLA